MGYMYDKLKIALEGSKFSDSHNIIKDWSPNEIKALFITRGCIIVVNHIKQPKVLNLDVRESEFDISKNGSTGSLHNLLTRRQLSCLEEIYVDSVFNNYRGCLDIDGYVRKSMSESSRLRYYGYINLNDVDNVVNSYVNARSKEDFTYSYAMDKGRTNTIQFTQTNNSKWYENYNLRPQFYTLDSENGSLARWFRMCRAEIEKVQEEQCKILEKTTLNNYIHSIFNVDASRMYDLRTLMRIYKYSGRYKDDEVLSTVHRIIGRKLKEDYTVKGLRVQDLKEAVTAVTDRIGDQGTYILTAYKNLGVFDLKSNKHIEMEDIEEYLKAGDGFLQLSKILEDICCNLYTSNKQVKMMLKVNSIVKKDIIPNGEFRRLVSLNEDAPANANYKGFLDLLLSLCGCTLETFNNVYLSLWRV